MRRRSAADTADALARRAPCPTTSTVGHLHGVARARRRADARRTRRSGALASSPIGRGQRDRSHRRHRATCAASHDLWTASATPPAPTGPTSATAASPSGASSRWAHRAPTSADRPPRPGVGRRRRSSATTSFAANDPAYAEFRAGSPTSPRASAAGDRDPVPRPWPPDRAPTPPPAPSPPWPTASTTRRRRHRRRPPVPPPSPSSRLGGGGPLPTPTPLARGTGRRRVGVAPPSADLTPTLKPGVMAALHTLWRGSDPMNRSRRPAPSPSRSLAWSLLAAACTSGAAARTPSPTSATPATASSSTCPCPRRRSTSSPSWPRTSTTATTPGRRRVRLRPRAVEVLRRRRPAARRRAGTRTPRAPAR